MQKKAMEFIEDVTNIFKDNIEKLYYQKYYISLPHEMYLSSAKKLDQDIFYGIDFEDSVGLGECITAIDEWNSELKKNNQKRTNELYDVNYVDELKEKCIKLEKENIIFKEEQEKMSKEKEKQLIEINQQKQQIEEYKDKYETKQIELEKVYNSKRWQLMQKIDNILRRNR